MFVAVVGAESDMCRPPGEIPFGLESLNSRNSYSYEELLECARGNLFGPGNARLPLPPMLMFDRITRITEDGGKYGKGEIDAELDIREDLWFFACHFESDPVMPGCLGLDALWQLAGFYLGWIEAPGRGRALGVGSVKFTGQVEPATKLVSYHVDIKRVIRRDFALGFADGVMMADGETVYVAENLRVGVFTSTDDM